MRRLARTIIEKTKIQNNADFEELVSYISDPESVSKMIEATNAGKPALSGIAKELEDRFSDCSGFPLRNDLQESINNKKNVGRIVKYVMAAYGYLPVSSAKRTRISTYSGSKCFSTSTIYEKSSESPAHKIVVLKTDVDASITREELFASPDNKGYESLNAAADKIIEKCNKLKADPLFLSQYLNISGYKDIITEKDIRDILSKEKVPSEELADSIMGFLTYIENCRFS